MAPLPSWRALSAGARGTRVDDTQLSAPWRRAGDVAICLSRSAWSLAVIAKLRSAQTGRRPRFFIPDFFCNAPLHQLRSSGAEIVFFPVAKTLEPDHAAFTSLASAGAPDVVVVVHYFGCAVLPAALSAIASVCRESGAWLVEDAAHVLRPSDGIGAEGDFILYSPHKHVPIPDGAVLVCRANGPGSLDAGAVLERMVATRDELSLPDHGMGAQPVRWMAKRVLQKVGVRSAAPPPPFDEDCAALAGLQAPTMSESSRRMMYALSSDLDAIADERSARAADWRSALSWAVGISTAERCAGGVPYLAEIETGKMSEARELYLRWQSAGLPVTTWPDLPPEVTVNPAAHAAAMELRRSRFYLPVHQSIPRAHIRLLGKRLLLQRTESWSVTEVGREEWDRHWARSVNANLLQAWEYGAAKERTEKWRAHRLLVSDAAKRPIALAQLLTRGLGAAGGVVRLSRGPVLIADTSSLRERAAALSVLLREARRRRWWVMRAAPELPSGQDAESLLEALGFARVSVPAWASGVLSLTKTESELRAGLRGKWRNSLVKGEKLEVSIEVHDPTEAEVEALLDSYSALQSAKGFVGLSPSLIRALAEQRGPLWAFRSFVARGGESAPDAAQQPIGRLVTIRHGDTATYLIGSTTEKGREMQANGVLLWRAILDAKQMGCAWFDIGGLNSSTPKGVAEFKRGLNPELYELTGEWSWHAGTRRR